MTLATAPAVKRTCVLYLDFVDALGDHLAALVASRIYWWCVVPSKNGKTKLRVIKDGQYWLAKSHADWEAELGLTRRQVGRVMEMLTRAGLITTMVTMFNGAPTTHIQYTGKIDPENRLPDKPNVQVSESLNAPIGAIEIPSGCNRLHQDVHSITCNTTSNTNMNSSKQLASSLPVSAAEVLQKFSQEKKTVPASGVMAMKMVWKKMQPEHLGFQKDLTAKEVGQLKTVHKALLGDAVPVLEWALTNWQQFSAEVQGLKGVQIVPTIPVVGFFSQHYEVAVSVMSKPKVKIVQSIAPPPQSKPTPAPAKKVEAPSEEEYLDVMAQLEQLTKK